MQNEEQAGLDYKVSAETSPVPSTPGLLSIPDPQRCDPMEDRSDDLSFVKIKVMHPYTLVSQLYLIKMWGHVLCT